MIFVDSLLNRVTMYRLMLYYLIFLVIWVGILGFFRLSPYTPFDILFSLGVVISISYITNKTFAKMFKAETNNESFLITILILTLITPIKFPQNLVLLIFVSFFSMASKYVLAYKKRHIFNPAALSLVAAFFFLGQGASWWIGSVLAMLPVVILGGILIIRKVQREDLVFGFFATYILAIVVFTFFKTQSLNPILSFFRTSFLDSSLFFFAFVMLLEPRTSPKEKSKRLIYAVSVGALFAVSQLGLLGSILTAELALVLGNLLSFIIEPNYRLSLILKSKEKLADNTYKFIFAKQNDFKFTAGQYMEWTLPHKNVDARGNRRYFSIFSSPTENEVAVTTKFYSPGSTYKQALLNLKTGNQIAASELSGDFILPKDLDKPLVFIAGGIGITPFRSMVKYISDKNLDVDIVLLYSNKTKEDAVFDDVFKKAQTNGVKALFINTEKEGRLDSEKIKKLVPNYQKRRFYLSGPQMLVESFKNILKDLGIQKSQIKTDFFPGYEDK